MKSRISSLDFLRGIAILIVLFNHCDVQNIPGFPDPDKFGSIFKKIYWFLHQLGWSGVELFFVLSGFLISGILFKEIEDKRTINFPRFWGRRAFKILPSYLFLLLVIYLTGATSFIDKSSLINSFKTLGVHLLFLQNYFFNHNGPTWSLAIEEHFYILLPLTLVLIYKFSNIKEKSIENVLVKVVFFTVFTICFIFRFIHSNFYDLGINTNNLTNAFMESHFRFDALFFGVFLKYLHLTKSPVISVIRNNRFKFLFLSILLSFLSVYFSRGSYFMFNFGFIFLSVGYSILITLFFGESFSRINKTFIYKMLTRIGLYSYNIYLWHWVIPKMNFLYMNDIFLFLAKSNIGVDLTATLQSIVFVLLGILSGFIFTKLIEDPFLIIRDRFFKSKYKISSPIVKSSAQI